MAGRFFEADGGRFLVRGVTYGTFALNSEGDSFPERDRVARDFGAMVAAGLNAVRTYEVPPPWMLDLAGEAGLKLLAGLAWTQHVAFLDDRSLCRSIRRSVQRDARMAAGHPALLGFAIGNEIPAPIVRWHGGPAVSGFLGTLRDTVKAADPEALVTYVNYPTTEYLELPFLDFLSFNVYLENRADFERYLGRLHNLAGNRPLLMAEIGLDSRRNGLEAQARSLDWQIRSTLESGAAGAFVFKWTDEWHRGGAEVDDWDFGLTTRTREPKPALQFVVRAYGEAPLQEPPGGWPSITVVCCSYNGAATIRRTLEAVTALDYPNFDVVVVDDGSTDATAGIAAEFPVTLVRQSNGGLSHARNVGAAASNAEIVVYIDDDAFPDAHWLHFLARKFRSGDWAAVGGTNILPPDSPPWSECVSHSPGAPVHVLLTDDEAEHIPGCNFAVRRDCLEDVGGFDPRFRAAGDDVDLCWRLQERGWRIGFHPGAMVFHHSRDRIGRYWSQQRGYGQAEAMLERKWPGKYDWSGHLAWEGRLYGTAFAQNFGWAPSRVYHGVWGSAPFQALYQRPPGAVLSIAMIPEWHLLVIVLSILSLLGLLWRPLLLVLPLLVITAAVPTIQAFRLAWKASGAQSRPSRQHRTPFILRTTLLHVIQPIARLWGRFGEGLTPWRRDGLPRWGVPLGRSFNIWSEDWRSGPEWADRVREGLLERGAHPLIGGGNDDWDLEVRGGMFGGARMWMTVEEHGRGRQLVRARIRTHQRFPGLKWAAIGLMGVASIALASGAGTAGSALAVLALGLGGRLAMTSGAAVQAISEAVRTAGEGSGKAEDLPGAPGEDA